MLAKKQRLEAGLSLRVAARTDVGLVRPNNEDSFIVADLSADAIEPLPMFEVGTDGALIGVCDGVGGEAGGEIASAMAAKTVAEYLRKHARRVDDARFDQELVRAIEKANRVIAQAAEQEPRLRGMSTTCTIAGIRHSRVTVAHVGDSRAYLFRSRELSKLTDDQSWAGQLAKVRGEQGAAPVTPSGDAPGANVLLQSVGTAKALDVNIASEEVLSGDRFLLCSDGLWGMVSDEKMRGVLASSLSLEDCCETLITLAKAGGGRDNITVVLCEVGDAEHWQSKTPERSVSALPGPRSSAGQAARPSTAKPEVDRQAGRWKRRVLAAAAVSLLVLAGALAFEWGSVTPERPTVQPAPRAAPGPETAPGAPQEPAAAPQRTLPAAPAAAPAEQTPGANTAGPRAMTRPKPKPPAEQPSAAPAAPAEVPLESWQRPQGQVAPGPFQ